jgi:hypothetical protein
MGSFMRGERRAASSGRVGMGIGLARWAMVIGCAWTGLATAADLTFYEQEGFRGRSFTAIGPVADFAYTGFNDRAASLVIRSGTWEICSDAHFRGRCVTLGRGEFASLRSMGLNESVSSARPIDGGGRITLFDFPDFGGRSYTLEGDTRNFDPLGINDRAVSAIVDEGTWQLCEHADYGGVCITLAPGRHPNLGRMSGQASSARLVAGAGPVAPPPGPGGLPGGWGSGTRAILYEGPNLTGRSFVINAEIVPDLAGTGFNDRASSLRIERGYWIFCSDANFFGECRTFGPGDYPTLPWDLAYRISSGRRIAGHYPYSGNPNWNPR